MQFSEVPNGELFQSDKFSDKGRLTKFKKNGGHITQQSKFFVEFGQMTFEGNAFRVTDGLIFLFQPEDPVHPSN